MTTYHPTQMTLEEKRMLWDMMQENHRDLAAFIKDTKEMFQAEVEVIVIDE